MLNCIECILIFTSACLVFGVGTVKWMTWNKIELKAIRLFFFFFFFFSWSNFSQSGLAMPVSRKLEGIRIIRAFEILIYVQSVSNPALQYINFFYLIPYEEIIQNYCIIYQISRCSLEGGAHRFRPPPLPPLHPELPPAGRGLRPLWGALPLLGHPSPVQPGAVASHRAQLCLRRRVQHNGLPGYLLHLPSHTTGTWSPENESKDIFYQHRF